MAKLIIRLINAVAEVVNNDPDVRGRLKVVFLPDFNVKNAQHIYPAADLSEQISTAGKEASGTGNMKFALNGALTIGTLDGANVEIREEVGEENFFLFGLTAEQVVELKAAGLPAAGVLRAERRRSARSIDLIASGALSGGDRTCSSPLVENLLRTTRTWSWPTSRPTWTARTRCGALWRDSREWTRMSILNVARMGNFSSDRSIRDYCAQVWKVKPVTVD